MRNLNVDAQRLHETEEEVEDTSPDILKRMVHAAVLGMRRKITSLMITLTVYRGKLLVRGEPILS